MRRTNIGAAPIVLALACLLLLLVGVWQTLVVVSPPGISLRFFWYLFLPVALGAVSIVVSTYWCVRPTEFRVSKGYLSLIGPVLCLFSVGGVTLSGARWFDETTLFPVALEGLPAPFVAGALFIREQALGLLWAALAFFAAALSMTSAGRFGNGGKSRGRLPWVWVTVGLVGAFDLILVRFSWWSRWGMLVEANPSRQALAFDGHISALDPDAWTVCSPFALGVLLVAVFPFFLLRLDRDGTASTGGAEAPSSSRQVVAALGFLGGCLCLAQALSSRASADIMLSLQHLLTDWEMTFDYWRFHEVSLGTSWLGGFTSTAITAIGLVVCALFLYRVKGTVKKALAPLLVGVGIFALGITLVRIAGLSPTAELEAESCDCCAGELMRELSSGGLELDKECIQWAHRTSEYRDKDLPVLEAGDVVAEQYWTQMPVIYVDSRRLKVNYREFPLPEGAALDSESIERNEDNPFVTELNAAIRDYKNHMEMIAARTGEPPKIEGVVLAVEPDVPEDLVLRIRRIAAKAGLVHGFFLVRSPSECAGLCRELRVVEAPNAVDDEDPSSAHRPFIQTLRERLE